MMFERYARDCFRDLESDADKRESLADDLAREILFNLHKKIFPRVEEIVARLNAMGHRLRAEYEPEPGDISFRDEELDPSGQTRCKLRLGVDLIVSAAYGGHERRPDLQES